MYQTKSVENQFQGVGGPKLKVTQEHFLVMDFFGN